jgi:hypothetical protein
MTSANVELVRSIYADWEVGDYKPCACEHALADLAPTMHRASERGGTRGANVLHFRDGKVMRFVSYWDRDHALADLGLEA